MIDATACAPTEPIDLATAFRRYEAEATHGACDTGRYRCPYFVWGAGPPLVFIHGLSDGAPSVVPLISLLASRFRCIAYDLPTGRGDGANLRRYTHAALTEDLFALLDHLQVRQSYVFGASFGSTIALAALHARPERLPRGLLQGGFARRPLARAEIALARVARYWPGRMSQLPLRRRLLEHMHRGPFSERPAEFWDHFVTRASAAPVAVVAQRAALLHHIDLRPALAGIHQPVLLICGDCDPLIGPECEEELLHGLANAGLVKLPGCGHNPLYSHPENLAAVVRAFLMPCGTCEQAGTCPLAAGASAAGH